MDNVGDWLYIVFLIIAGISSLFSSKSKKKSPQQVLRQPVSIPTQKQRKKRKTEPAAFLTAEQMTDRPMPAESHLAIFPTEEENPLADIEFDNAAELRKAVIYTEILNRKY